MLCPYIKLEMHVIFARRARLADGWAENVRLTLADGRISALEVDAKAANSDTRVDTVLPALGNLHSHTFQRAMAGMSEHRSKGRDSFWSWRHLMYRFLDHLTPEHIEAIAAQVYMEMQEAGYASVGEFHYVHHQPGGQRYDNMAETSHRIFAAANTTGIGLTHLPVLYSHGGATAAPLTGGQLRFGNTPDAFAALLASASPALKSLPGDARMGLAPHSLRAVDPEGLALAQQMRPLDPIHIHIAEQPAEVSQIMAWLGARPVEWLLDNARIDERWCLIHATHMSDAETLALARSGAVAGLCPITEANLGDGPFNGAPYFKANGAFGIGSDSNVRISLAEELRLLEYSQRLRDLCRNVLTTDGGSVGETLYLGAAKGGAQALGRSSGTIALGALADLVAIDSTSASLCALASEQLLDGLVFAADDTVVTDVWSAGRHCVISGRHKNRDAITSRYRRAIQDIRARL